MRYLIIISIFFISNTWAMKPLPFVDLTPTLAKKLGFRVSFEVTNSNTTMSIAAPNTIDSCSFRRSVVEVINSNGDIVAGTILNASLSNDEIYIDGYIADSALNMRVGITYICIPNSGKRGKIYMVNSIKDFLISTQQ